MANAALTIHIEPQKQTNGSRFLKMKVETDPVPCIFSFIDGDTI